MTAAYLLMSDREFEFLTRLRNEHRNRGRNKRCGICHVTDCKAGRDALVQLAIGGEMELNLHTGRFTEPAGLSPRLRLQMAARQAPPWAEQDGENTPELETGGTNSSAMSRPGGVDSATAIPQGGDLAGGTAGPVRTWAVGRPMWTETASPVSNL